ncbi:MAG TPA: hypothetical protein VIL86_11260 [Tepidisphaeraceae bacterium]|jgi:pimeloyl-ACP methyl ester carboxylesterase
MNASIRYLVPLLFLAAGCSAPSNPSFNLSVPDGQRALQQMRRNPKPLQHPLIIISGFADPGVASGVLKPRFEKLSGDDRMLGLSFAFSTSFDAAREKLIKAVDARFPTDDPEQTTEVDVIAVSMGGLVARHAAAPTATTRPAQDTRRLRIRRLFTISSPHRGAVLASFPTFNSMHKDMRPGSPFLTALNATPLDYEIIPYVRLGDNIVGAANAAPPGMTPWWVPNQPLENAHAGAFDDSRILADIARRLRGEASFTKPPAMPLPKE